MSGMRECARSCLLAAAAAALVFTACIPPIAWHDGLPAWSPEQKGVEWRVGYQHLSAFDADQLPKETRKIFDGVHYKYDFWVGTQDSFLYQQNVEILFAAGTILEDAPAMQMDVLMTFFDINDPNISVNPPI